MAGIAALGGVFLEAREIGLRDLAIDFLREKQRDVDADAFDAVGVDQLFEVALDDEAAGEEIQPDGLTMVFECFDGIHDVCSVRPVFGLPGSFRVRGRNVNTWRRAAGRIMASPKILPEDN